MDPITALIALEHSEIPSQDELLKFYQKIASPQLMPVHAQQNSNTLTFEVDGEEAVISFISTPIPWEDLQRPCSTAWYWTEAREEMQRHQAHVLISIMPQNPNRSSLERTMSLTQIAASVAKAADGIGVYWKSGDLVQSTKYFVDECTEMSPDYLPLDLWIDFRIEQSSDEKCNIITTGMDAFGYMEIEIVQTNRDAYESFEFAFNMADYVLKNNFAIKDGEIIGENQNGKITVQYSKSIWNRKNEVMRVLI